MTLTPTEQKLFDLLKDGNRHHKVEMLQLLDLTNDETDVKALQVYICRLRGKLLDQGLKIVHEFYQRRRYYILVRNLVSQNSG